MGAWGGCQLNVKSNQTIAHRSHVMFHTNNNHNYKPRDTFLYCFEILIRSKKKYSGHAKYIRDKQIFSL